MNYYTGESIKLGDYVELSSNMTGVIVTIIDDAKYSKLYLKEEWEYLECGLLILSDEAGLVHFPSVTEEIIFINRNQDSNQSV